ncbi:MAG: Hsp33 family molecular chaperone HslO, partial [Firmicutes bacterium]|nr:Hsp33 family molecular chaperone HslO [Bacillota bacterium]
NIRGDGPAKGLTVTADSKGNVKGYCFENMVDIPLKENGKLDVSGAIGNGELTVIKDMGLKEPYVGTIPLISGEIAEDITYYFAKSEQTPSAVALGVLVDRDYSIKAAGGFIIQMMPGAEDNVIDKTEEKLKTLPAVTKMYESGMTAEDILEKLFGDMELNRESIIKTEAAYKCNCTREKVEKALIAIGKKEIEKIIEEDGKAELHCHFCNKDYLFGENDLKEILLRI